MACTRHLLEGVSYAKTLRYTTSNCITIRHESIQKLCFCLRTWLLSNTVVRATMYLLFYSSTTRHKSKKDILFENIVYAFVFKATRLLCWRSSLLHNTILKQNCFFTVESLNYFVFFLCFLNVKDIQINDAFNGLLTTLEAFWFFVFCFLFFLNKKQKQKNILSASIRSLGNLCM